METKDLKEILGTFINTSNIKDEQHIAILQAMQEVAKLSHNNAIRLASESAELTTTKNDNTTFHRLTSGHYACVSKDSILKLLKS